jgi:heptosyltransferase-2
MPAVPKERGGTLIVKLGAPGDVVRTTPLLRALRGPVTWVTRPESAPLLPRRPGLTVLTPDAAPARLRGLRFALVLCLDDEPEAARIAQTAAARRRVGARMAPDGRVCYDAASRSWFDMGLLSRLGRRRADALKRANALSWQEHLFRMAGLRFRGEEYWIRTPPRSPRPRRPVIGLETRAGERWPSKRWTRYAELARALRARGARVARFSWKKDLRAHAAAVAACDVVVCGDTLTMHLALALRKRVVALFLCTPPQEIEDYGRLVKIVSPVLARHLYSRRADRRAAGAIPLAPVLAETLTALAQSYHPEL